jgi:small-conductance mechanosensitive channel
MDWTMNDLPQWLRTQGPSWAWAWGSGLGAGVLLALALRVVRQQVLGRLQRRSAHGPTVLHDVALAAVRATRGWALTLGALAAGLRLVAAQGALPERLAAQVDPALLVVVVLQIGLWLQAGLSAWLQQRQAARAAQDDVRLQSHIAIVEFVSRILIWSLLLLLLLDNLGFNITALVASLGIGGIAVALAVQNILGDLFASLSIAIDKPFLVGDAIQVDGLSGTVRQVGLKTTRIQATSGEELVMSNADLLKSRIRNFKRMDERRVSFRFGVTYDTPADVLAGIPAIVRRLVETAGKARFDRCHLVELGASSLDFEVVYHVTTPSYMDYMDLQQTLNLGLLRELPPLGAAFAFPTQTLNVAGPPAAARTLTTTLAAGSAPLAPPAGSAAGAGGARPTVEPPRARVAAA